jgi:hypothetical protein
MENWPLLQRSAYWLVDDSAALHAQQDLQVVRYRSAA